MIAEVEPQSPARSLEDLQKTVSATRLNTWLQCRLKFYFRYVAQVKKRPTPALHIGKVVHAVLQAWNKARWRRQPFAVEQFKTLFESDWAERQTKSAVGWEGEEEKERNHSWSLLETYFLETPIKANEMPEAVEVLVEAELPGLPKLIGIIDLVRSGGRIVDFKTAGQTPTAEKAAHLHEIQVSAYAVMYRHATNKREQALELHHLVKLKTPKLVITSLAPMTSEQETRLYRLMESYVQGLSRQDFVPSPGLGCMACEYFNECRRWH
jgi:putative RecB family exonuclease